MLHDQNALLNEQQKASREQEALRLFTDHFDNRIMAFLDDEIDDPGHYTIWYAGKGIKVYCDPETVEILGTLLLQLKEHYSLWDQVLHA